VKYTINISYLTSISLLFFIKGIKFSNSSTHNFYVPKKTHGVRTKKSIMALLSRGDLDAPWQKDILLQVRTSKMKPMHNLSITTGIYKLPRTERVYCGATGFESDEHDPTFHGGVDKAVHQYYPGHYPVWRSEYPDGQNFDVGGFGENLVSEKLNERNVCIGDKIRIGGALLQVSLPRQPCFKLNHRFNLKSFSSQTWKKSRTGWYYRVLEEGWVAAGDEIILIERNTYIEIQKTGRCFLR
jgi:MOSC domain-containing protein YiiM